MSQNNSFSVKKYNKVVAKILQNNRIRSSLSLNDVCSKAVHTTKNELEQFESAALSPRGYQLYELFQVYRKTFTIDEYMFFCTPPSTHEEVLSIHFKQTYFADDFSTRRQAG